MTQRVACLVPGCRRTHRAVFPEWICADHWRAVDRRLKRTRAALRLRLWRRGEMIREDGRWYVSSDRARRIMDRLWARMKRQAVERAAGI